MGLTFVRRNDENGCICCIYRVHERHPHCRERHIVLKVESVVINALSVLPSWVFSILLQYNRSISSTTRLSSARNNAIACHRITTINCWGFHRPGLLGLLKAVFVSTFGNSSSNTSSSVISLGSSTSNFFSAAHPHSFSAMVSTARFCSG